MQATRQETMALLGAAQAMVIANLAHALARCAGLRPEVVADLMEGQDMRHEDRRAEILAEGLQRAALMTLRSSAPAAGSA